MRRWIRNPRGLKVRRYADHLIELNKYLASLPGSDMDEKNGMTELNEILLNIMSNIWINQAYVHVFYCKSITFKYADNMFESIYIYIYIFTKV